jgi:hypothetical protein
MRAKPVHFLEQIAPGRLATIWALTTSDSMEMILRPEYFDKYTSYGLRKNDRLMITANVLDANPECGWLRVVSAADGLVAVTKD